jgi:hypothetical protein
MPAERHDITPAEDPYAFDWPDDAKEARAEQRAAEASRASVRPAPLLLSAITIGIGTVLVFVLPVAVVAGALSVWVAMAAPIVIGGLVLALLPAIVLERVTRTWRRGLPEIAFLVLGLVIGAGWTWLAITVFDGPSAFRVRTSVFMGTAVAAAFFAARAWAEPLRRYPRYLYTAAGLIALLTLASLANFVLFNVNG